MDPALRTTFSRKLGMLGGVRGVLNGAKQGLAYNFSVYQHPGFL